MSGKQHKRELKRQKELARQRAAAAERRRTMFTVLSIVVIIGLGAVLIAISADDAPDIEPAAAPTEVVPTDPSVEPGTAEDSGLEPVVDDRPVACDAGEPEAVGEVKPTYPGGPGDVLEPGVDYRAVVETSCGTVEFDLLEGAAREAVNSFVFLAQEGFFDGLEIFRNATGIGALQTGGGDNTDTWRIGYALPDELEGAEAAGYPPGTVAMANSGPNSAGSQFFFVYNDQFALDPTFTAFGTVTQGLDVLQRIGDIAVEGERGETPAERVYMEDVTIQTGTADAPTPAATS